MGPALKMVNLIKWSRGVVPMTKAANLPEFNVAAHGLRGVASMMVFFAHILGGTAEHVYYRNTYYVDLIQAPWKFGTWGVELFFVISGFVILPSVLRYTPREFAWRRFLRIYPLFFVLSLLFVVLNAATNDYPKLNNTEAIIAGLLFLNLVTGTEQPAPNAWSLTFEVVFYAFACAIAFFGLRQRNTLITVILIICALAFVFRYPIAVYFLFGVLTRIVHNFLSNKTAKILPPWSMTLELLFLASCVVVSSTYDFSYEPSDLGNPLVYVLMISTGGYFFMAVSPDSLTSKLLNCRPIVYLGSISYSLYLVHPYTYFIGRKLFEKFEFFGENWFISMGLFFLIVTPITLAITHLVHVALERWPYNWFFHQRIYRNPVDTSK